MSEKLNIDFAPEQAEEESYGIFSSNFIHWALLAIQLLAIILFFSADKIACHISNRGELERHTRVSNIWGMDCEYTIVYDNLEHTLTRIYAVTDLNNEQLLTLKDKLIKRYAEDSSCAPLNDYAVDFIDSLIGDRYSISLDESIVLHSDKDSAIYICVVPNTVWESHPSLLIIFAYYQSLFAEI